MQEPSSARDVTDPDPHAGQDMDARGGFAGALAAVAGVEGWMTDAQARVLWERAAALEAPATVVEIGSYRGRSAIVLARAVADGVAVVAIDPHAGNDRGPQQIHGSAAEGQGDHEVFLANLAAAGVGERVRHVRLPSQDALDAVDGTVELLYIDGAHRYAPARDDIAEWGARVPAGGTMLIHDSFSSVGVTLAILRLLLVGDRFRYVGRAGSLARYRAEAPAGPRDRALNAGRQLAELPWFARNVLVKVAIVLRLRPLARALGHRDGPWPY
jgi:predicted O-methyltransferase YrrM